MQIGFSKISDSKSYRLYEEWLRSTGRSFQAVNFAGMSATDAVTLANHCSGLVLTGGSDVNPALYGKPDDSQRCYANPKRDELENALIGIALERRIPILAICRGAQLLNVIQGGSLIVDIVTDYGTAVRHGSGTDEVNYHSIGIDQSSYLFGLSEVRDYSVSTLHHQAICRLAECFRAVAHAPDGIVEAYEWKEPEDKSHLLAVQWHPEVMDYSDKFCIAIVNDFLNHAEQIHS